MYQKNTLLIHFCLIPINNLCNNYEQDLKTWVQGKQEVEVVDMILKIRQKLEKSCIDDLPIDNSIRERLRERINDITHELPDDLKVILRRES